MHESEWLSRDRRLVSVHCVTNEFIVTNYCVYCRHFISDWRKGRDGGRERGKEGRDRERERECV